MQWEADVWFGMELLEEEGGMGRGVGFLDGKGFGHGMSCLLTSSRLICLLVDRYVLPFAFLFKVYGSRGVIDNETFTSSESTMVRASVARNYRIPSQDSCREGSRDTYTDYIHSTICYY